MTCGRTTSTVFTCGIPVAGLYGGGSIVPGDRLTLSCHNHRAECLAVGIAGGCDVSDRISGYFDSGLGPKERQALEQAVDWTQDHVALATDGQLDTSLVDYLIDHEFLPARYRHRYDEGFVRRFLAVLEAVIDKLGRPDSGPLESTAQELVLHGLLASAEELAELNGVDVDFDLFRNSCLEDLDHELLYHPAFDGVEDVTDPELRFANLAFVDWFKPFRP